MSSKCYLTSRNCRQQTTTTIMRTNLSIRPWLGAVDRVGALIAAVGYEQRSTQVAKIFQGAAIRHACGFSEQHTLHYKRNRAWYEHAGFRTAEVDDAGFSDWAVKAIDGIVDSNVNNIVIDISSFSRVRLAILVKLLLLPKHHAKSLQIDFLYSQIGR